MKPQKVLLYVDATQESQKALQTAMELGADGAEIIAVNVVSRHLVSQLMRASGQSPAEIEVELEENGWRYLYSAEDQAKDAGVRIVVLQETGYPEEILPRLAAEYHTGLIVIGQSARVKSDSNQSRLAQQLIEHAACAVLVVK